MREHGRRWPLDEARILVVDDEPPNVRLLQRVLEQAGYVNVEATTDSRRVAGLLTGFAPDLILLDLLMPHLDGFEVMDQLTRLVPSSTYLPILVLTADITAETKRKALARGAKDFITKPFDLEEVLLRIRNMLETRQLHLQLRKQNEELEERVRIRTLELERALATEHEASERLRELDELRSAFLTAVSHELRTPLTSVLGGALTLEQHGPGLSDEDRDGLVHGVVANARKLNRLLSDLLDIDRLVRGIAEPVRTRTDLGALITRAVAESEISGEHPVEVRADPVMIDIDAPKVERIVQNLVVNAGRHTPPGTPIWVRTCLEEEGILIIVEDAGPGVPEDLRTIIFEPFQQGEHLIEHAPGVGIGLSLVSRFTQLHGGKAWVEERPGGGASFRVFLPAATELVTG
ncbi:MAG: ATP-binding response regulator [Actinomycetota bacterium]